MGDYEGESARTSSLLGYVSTDTPFYAPEKTKQTNHQEVEVLLLTVTQFIVIPTRV